MSIFKNKVVEENPDMLAAKKRAQEKKQKEVDEMVSKIQQMNRHQRRAFAKINGVPKIQGTRRDHIK